MFIAALLTIAKKLEATKMSFSRWADKLWYSQVMEYYQWRKRMTYQVKGKYGW
jgi:hypothetical protein